MENIGIAISDWLKSRNLNQSYLADELGVSQAYINKVLKSSKFGANAARKWSETFGFSLNFLLTGKGDLFVGESVTMEKTVHDLNDAPTDNDADNDADYDADYWKKKFEQSQLELQKERAVSEGLRIALGAVKGTDVQPVLQKSV